MARARRFRLPGLRWLVSRRLLRPVVGGGREAAGQLRAPSSLRRFLEEFSCRPVVVILSGTPLDPDLGQRPGHLARALARSGAAVVFAYWLWPGEAGRPQDALGEGIFQVPLDGFLSEGWRAVVDGADGERGAVLVEFPLPAAREALEGLAGAGWPIVYDVLDDWEAFAARGQAHWYDEGFERWLVSTAAAVSAVSPRLGGRVREMGRDDAAVVPNGLDPFQRVARRRPRRRAVTAGYVGYLAAAWFHWELLLETARRRPDLRFEVVGYGGEPQEEAPSNLVLLGRRPRGEIPRLAAGWDVGLVPFRPGPVAEGSDPIKLYEYLDLGLPVVATGIVPPARFSGLLWSVPDRWQDLARAIDEAACRRPRLARRGRRLVRRETWQRRAATLLRLAGRA